MLNFSELAPNIGFSEFDFYDLYMSTFENIELGRIKKLLPLHAKAENFGLVSKEMLLPIINDLTRALLHLPEKKTYTWKCASQGDYASVIENRHNIRTTRSERDIKTEI